MQTNDELTEALEDYLEAIYRIILKKSAVRVKDIAAALKVKNPSVTAALQALTKRGLINYEPYGVISLTQTGFDAAVRVSEKHRLLKSFLEHVLGIDTVMADDTACRMEHVIPRDVYVRLVQFIKFLYVSQDVAGQWKKDFGEFLSTDLPEVFCGDCLSEYFDGTGFDPAGGSHDTGNA